MASFPAETGSRDCTDHSYADDTMMLFYRSYLKRSRSPSDPLMNTGYKRFSLSKPQKPGTSVSVYCKPYIATLNLIAVVPCRLLEFVLLKTNHPTGFLACCTT